MKIIEHSPYAKFKNFNGTFRWTPRVMVNKKSEVGEIVESIASVVQYTPDDYERTIAKMIQNEKDLEAKIESYKTKLAAAEHDRRASIHEMNAFRTIMFLVEKNEINPAYLSEHMATLHDISDEKLGELIQMHSKCLSRYALEHRSRASKVEIKVENIVRTSEKIEKTKKEAKIAVQSI
jgi:hypothetical protein